MVLVCGVAVVGVVLVLVWRWCCVNVVWCGVGVVLVWCGVVLEVAH